MLNLNIISPVTASILFVFFTLWIIWRRRKLSYFKRLNIPGPIPNFLNGNITELNEKGPAICQKEWTEKYGKILGYYIGLKPILLVADPELIKLIEIKNFADFTDRGEIIQRRGLFYNSLSKDSVINKKGEKWKETRSILTPTFSSSKIKQMMPLMEDSVSDLMDIIDNKAKKKEPFDIYDLYQLLTLDVISKTAFGINANMLKNPKKLFMETCKFAFSNTFQNYVMLFFMYFPELRYIAEIFAVVMETFSRIRNKPSRAVLVKAISDVIKFRRSNESVHRIDLLQLMIDANMSVQEMKAMTHDKLTISEDSDLGTISNTESSSKSQKRHMTDNEIKGNALLFLLAGYETTSTALGFTTHLLTVHQDVQEKLREEINEIIKEYEILDYSAVLKMKYLDQIFSESLRLYSPSLTFIRRSANRTFNYKGITIPKNTVIQMAIWCLHHDPEYWPDPENFLPERFSAENKSKIESITYQPFGAGPRNCIGMRFAQLEAKLAIAKILHSYKLMPEGEVKQKAEVAYSLETSRPKNGVRVKAIPVSH